LSANAEPACKHLCLCGTPATFFSTSREIWLCDKHSAVQFGFTVEEIDEGDLLQETPEEKANWKNNVPF
jgi:hypothetical protein